MGKVIKAIVGVVAAVVGVVTGNFSLIAGGASLIGGALKKKSKGGGEKPRASSENVLLGEVPRTAGFGRIATAGSLNDAFNYGGQYGTDWELLNLDLFDHRCDALEGFYVNDTYVPFTGDGDVAGYNGQLKVWFRAGTEFDTVPSVVLTNGPGWTANDRGAGICKVFVAYKADASDAQNPVWSSGRPRFLWVVRGALCYDPRKDSSVGGVGPHRWNDPATREWSENVAVCRYNYARGIYACDRVNQPEQLLVGRGLSETEAPPANVFARANLCDELVDGEPRYRVGGAVEATEEFGDVESDFALACAGEISQPQGAVEIDPGEAKAAVVTITDEDLVIGGTVKVRKRFDLADRDWVNTVIASYIDPAQKWQPLDAPVRRTIADIQADKMPRELRLRLGFVHWPKQAGRIGEIFRRLGRLPIRADIPLGPRFCFLEEGDWIIWQSNRYFGGQAFTFRIEAWGQDQKRHMLLRLRQISASVYSDTAPLDSGAVAVNQPSRPPIPAPSGWILSAGHLSAGGMRVPALIVTGNVTDPNARFMKFEYVLGAAAPTGATIWTDAGVSGPDVKRREINAAPGGTYHVAVSFMVDGVQGQRLILGPVTALSVTYPDGTAVQAVQPGEAGATNDADRDNPDIMPIDEKIRFQRLADAREQRYQKMRPRAQAVGASTLNADSARANFLAFVSAITPPVTDLSQPSPINRTTYKALDTAYEADLANLDVDSASEYATPEAFGYSNANSQAANSLAMQKAFAASRSIWMPDNKRYATTLDLVMTSAQKQVAGGGILEFIGNCGLILTGGANGHNIEVTIDAPLHTGTAIKVDNANRIDFRKIHVIDCFNLMDARQFNTMKVNWLWATCRGHGVRLYGNDTVRSDIAEFGTTYIDPGNNEYGFDWDGNVNTVLTNSFGIIGGKGAIIRNTDGTTTFPAIGRLNGFQVDYPTEHGLEIKAGLDFDLVAPYFLGSQKSGLKIGPTINSYQVRMVGGKSVGNGRYGIENAGGPMQISGAEDLTSNALGATFGNVWTKMVRAQFDDQFYITLDGGGNPLTVYDLNDYTGYDRAGNALFDVIGGVTTFIRRTTGSAINTNLLIGGVGLASERLEVVGNAKISGWLSSPRHEIDATNYLTLDGLGNPLIAFAPNDYLVYDRAGNTLALTINGIVSSLARQGGLSLPGTLRIGDTALASEKLEVLGNASISGWLAVDDVAYGAGWDGSFRVPTRNAVYDKINAVDATVAGKVNRAGDEFTGPMSFAQNVLLRFGHVNQIDSNDGKIVTELFGSGLNIVGTQTVPGQGRYIRIHSNIVQITGYDQNYLQQTVFLGAAYVPDAAYSSAWNTDLAVPTRNAVFDEMELVKASVTSEATARANADAAEASVRASADNALDARLDFIESIVSISGGNPFLVWDANDYDAYDRTNNIRQFVIGGNSVLALDQFKNVLLGGMSPATSATGAIHIANGSAPSANPSGGGVMWADAGALKYRGSSGTVTTVAPA